MIGESLVTHKEPLLSTLVYTHEVTKVAPHTASGWADHQKDQVVRGLELSAPPTYLREKEGGGL